MGNVIWNYKAGERHLGLSNGGTSVLLSVLLLSGSDEAASLWEKECVAWLAEHDQGIFGLGMVGFDIDELAWSTDAREFEAQKAFVLRVADRAVTRHRWEALSYDPPFALSYLRELRALIEGYRFEFVGEEARSWAWRCPGPREPRKKCPRHDVYLHACGSAHHTGCLLCNDDE